MFLPSLQRTVPARAAPYARIRAEAEAVTVELPARAGMCMQPRAVVRTPGPCQGSMVL